ncbi:reverse transcriptase domain-containing protein [Streptomyces sp. NPDC002306]
MVQAALKLVLEPIFEADFKPVSYGFRPLRRAHDAIAEIHFYGTHGYHWILDAGIEACFDSIDHVALMDRDARAVKDKRVSLLVKAFLKPASSPRATIARTLSPAPRRAASSPRCWRTSPCRRSTST